MSYIGRISTPKSRKTTPNDVIMTKPETAKWIIDYFKPTGTILEPCKGDGAFYNQFEGDKDWCEIREGKDFFDYNKRVDWIITNPPFSIFDNFLIKAFEVAVKSQKAALDMLRPGVTAEDVHSAYADTIQSEGYPYPTFRCGRGTGFSFLEEPQLVVGNKTILQPGMVFAVDGGASAKNFRSQVGDSFIITEEGYEQITHHSKKIEDLII